MISFANQHEYTSTDFHEHFSYSESLRVSYNIFLHTNLVEQPGLKFNFFIYIIIAQKHHIQHSYPSRMQEV